jgi:hypothetical protein
LGDLLDHHCILLIRKFSVAIFSISVAAEQIITLRYTNAILGTGNKPRFAMRFAITIGTVISRTCFGIPACGRAPGYLQEIFRPFLGEDIVLQERGGTEGGRRCTQLVRSSSVLLGNFLFFFDIDHHCILLIGLSRSCVTIVSITVAAALCAPTFKNTKMTFGAAIMRHASCVGIITAVAVSAVTAWITGLIVHWERTIGWSGLGEDIVVLQERGGTEGGRRCTQLVSSSSVLLLFLFNIVGLDEILLLVLAETIVHVIGASAAPFHIVGDIMIVDRVLIAIRELIG